jgi:hypothetical protein
LSEFFTSGRLIVIVATPSAISRRMGCASLMSRNLLAI